MEGKLLKCPKELRNHPVLAINESTNNFVIKRRAKVSKKHTDIYYYYTNAHAFHARTIFYA